MLAESKSRRLRNVASFVRLLRQVPVGLRTVGPFYAMALMARRLFPGVVDSFYVCELDLRSVRHSQEPDPEIRPGVFPDDRQILIDLGVSAKELPEQINASTYFWVLERQSHPIAYMWMERSDFGAGVYDWLRVVIRPDDVRAVFLWVAPDCRGQAIGGRLNRYAASESVRAGCERIVSIVDSLNRRSLRSDRKVGYRRMRHICCVQLLGWTLVLIGWRPRLGRWNAIRPLKLGIEELEPAYPGGLGTKSESH